MEKSELTTLLTKPLNTHFSTAEPSGACKSLTGGSSQHVYSTGSKTRFRFIIKPQLARQSPCLKNCGSFPNRIFSCIHALEFMNVIVQNQKMILQLVTRAFVVSLSD